MRTHLAILALTLLTACSGSDPKSLADAGNNALGKGDNAGALAKFEAALDGLDVQHPEYLRAAIGRSTALAHFEPARARTTFLDLAKAMPEKVREGDYSLICYALLQADANLDAVEVMHAGNGRFKGSATMKDMVDAVMNAAKRAKTPEALARLASLGYT